MKKQQQFEQICRFLDGRNLEYGADVEQQMVGLEIEGMVVMIVVSDNPQIVRLVLPQILTLSENSPHFKAVLEILLRLERQSELARWQQDPSDDEVWLQADLPVEDSQLSGQQLWQTLWEAVQIAKQAREQVRRFLQTSVNDEKKYQETNNQPKFKPKLKKSHELLLVLIEKIKENGKDIFEIHPILSANLDHLNLEFANTVKKYCSLILRETSDPEKLQSVFTSIGVLGSIIQQFLPGNQSFNIQIAIACYEATLMAWKRDTAPMKWAATQMMLGGAYLEFPRNEAANLQKAIDCYEAALTVWTRDTAPSKWVILQSKLGIVYSYLPTENQGIDLHKAIDCYKAALTIWTRDTAPSEWAMLQSMLGRTYSDLPTVNLAVNLQKVIECYEAALTVWTRDDAFSDWVTTRHALGRAYSNLPTGDLAANLPKAIECYEDTLAVWKHDTEPSEWARIQCSLGQAYSNLPTGDLTANLQKAIECYEDALAAVSKHHNHNTPSDWAMIQSLLGNAYVKLPTGDKARNLERAIEYFEAALTVWTRYNALSNWARTQGNLGIVYYELPTGDRAVNLQKAIDCHQAALTVRTPEADPLDWAMTQNNLGLAYSDLPTGDRAVNLKQAIECYKAALTVQKLKLVPLHCRQTANNWGNLEFNEGHWQKALNLYQLAIQAVEELRRSALSEDRRQQIVRESIYVYENAIQAAVNLGNISTALEIVERVRAKRLVDLMATADLYQDGDIPPEVRQWLQQLDDIDNRISRERQQLQKDDPLENFDDRDELKLAAGQSRQLRAAITVSAEISDLERQKQSVLDQLNGRDEVIAKVRQLQPPKLTDFIPLLRDSPKAALVSFYTTRNDTHIFILRHGQTTPDCFTCKGQGLETLQLWLRQTWVVPYASDKTQWREQMPHTLGEIARRLDLDQLITEKLQNLEELILVPHLFLHQIPFAAIPLRDGYLGDKFRLRYAPSLQVLGFCQNRDPLTDTRYGTVENATDDLPFSGFEGESVAQLFAIDRQRRLIRSEATRDAYRQLLNRTTRLVSSHHAQSRFDNPLESGLRLRDGSISVSQLFSPAWRFPQLDEVYLSCCETGLFLPNSAIDEPVAISTGFLCAGARGVVASLWAIYDLSAALLSTLYHEQRQAGKNRPEALQAAQQKMRGMTGAEFQKDYRKAILQHLKREKRSGQDPAQVTRLADAEKAIKRYAADKGCPFAHPVHWASLGCYGLA